MPIADILSDAAQHSLLPPLRAVSQPSAIIHYSAPHGRKTMDPDLLLLLIGVVLPIVVVLFLLWHSVF